MYNLVRLAQIYHYNLWLRGYMKTNIQKRLGERIQKLRKLNGLSQETLAEQLGIATNTLSSIETGNAFMTSSTLEKIIETLNVSPQELFTFGDEHNNLDMYSYILKKLKSLKHDKDRLKILYSVIKGMF